MKRCITFMFILHTIGNIGFLNAYPPHSQVDAWFTCDTGSQQIDVKVTEAAAAATAAVLVVESVPEIVGAFTTAFNHIGRRVLGMGKPQKTQKELEEKETKRKRRNQQVQVLKEWYQSHPQSIPEYIFQQVAHNQQKQQAQTVDTTHQSQQPVNQPGQINNDDVISSCDNTQQINCGYDTQGVDNYDCESTSDTQECEDDVTTVQLAFARVFAQPDDVHSIGVENCRVHKSLHDDEMCIAGMVVVPEYTDAPHDLFGKKKRRHSQMPATTCCGGGSGKNDDTNNACPCPVPCGCDENCKCRTRPKYTYENGTYDGASYHHSNSNGNKSPAPLDGQKALDNSVPIEGSNRHRISVCFGEFVVLHMTHRDGPHGPIYHGHIRKHWNDLSREMQNSLLNAGLVREKAKKIRIVEHATKCPFCY